MLVRMNAESMERHQMQSNNGQRRSRERVALWRRLLCWCCLDAESESALPQRAERRRPANRPQHQETQPFVPSLNPKRPRAKPFEMEEEISELEIPLLYVEQPSQSMQSKSSRNSVWPKKPGSEWRLRSNPQTDEQSIRSGKHHQHFIRQQQAANLNN